MLFEGFELREAMVDGARLRLRRGGAGPPLLLLHGNPQTHLMWHAVAPALAERFTVVCPDLRGYGFSHKPDPSPDHAPYAKRAMAAELAALMRQEGFDRYAVVAHDRGARVAHRLALDHPNAVARLAVLDIVPTLEHFERTDMAFALGYWHWFFLAQPHDLPERMMRRDLEDWFDLQTSREPKPLTFFHPEARADYLAALRTRNGAEGVCEDYRAAATIDLVHDRADRGAGRRLRCPLLALWGEQGKIGRWYDPLETWGRYCDGPVSGRALPAGHYIAEEAPGALLAALEPFLGAAG